jgi:DNA-binding transcriptional ArsR family regulator
LLIIEDAMSERDVAKINEEKLTLALAALANPLRRKIIIKLAVEDQNVGSLADGSGVSLPAISRHLSTLQEADLIERRREGREQMCRLNISTLKLIDEWLGQFKPMWELQKDTLSEFLQQLRENK